MGQEGLQRVPRSVTSQAPYSYLPALGDNSGVSTHTLPSGLNWGKETEQASPRGMKQERKCQDGKMRRNKRRAGKGGRHQVIFFKPLPYAGLPYFKFHCPIK